MSETKKSKEAGETRIEDLTTRINKAEAKIATLKEEVTELSKELAALVKGQAEMDKLRMEENEEYKAAKAELEKGLNGGDGQAPDGGERGVQGGEGGAREGAERRGDGVEGVEGLLRQGRRGSIFGADLRWEQHYRPDAGAGEERGLGPCERRRRRDHRHARGGGERLQQEP